MFEGRSRTKTTTLSLRDCSCLGHVNMLIDITPSMLILFHPLIHVMAAIDLSMAIDILLSNMILYSIQN